MHTKLYNHGSFMGYLGHIFNMTQGMPSVETVPYTNTSFATIVLSHDPVLAPILRGNVFVDLGLASFDAPPLGFQTPSELFPTPVHSRKYDLQFDESHNASTLHRIFDFLHSGLHPRSPNMYNENLGMQSNYRGSAAIGDGVGASPLTSDLLAPFGLGHFGLANVTLYQSEYHSYGMYLDGTAYSVWYPTIWRYSYLDWLTKMASHDVNSNADPFRYSGTYKVALDKRGLDGYTAKVSCSVQFYGVSPVYCTYRWSYTLDIFGIGQPGFVKHPVVADFYLFGDTASSDLGRRLSITDWSVSCDVPSQDVSVPDLGPLFGPCFTTAKAQTFTPATPAQYGDPDPRVVIRDRAYSFGSACYHEIPHLRDASYLSTVNSVESMQRGTNSDILQTLAKLPDAASMIPKINEFIHLCEEIHHKGFNIVTLKDLVDLAASTNLQSNFQWQPFQRFITEQLPEVVRGIVQGWTRNPYVVGRGKFFYAFPDEFLGYPQARLTARSKIVVDTGINSVFATVLGLDGLGILPKPSNLWDLIPLSFTINWITGVGANIRRAENGLFLLAFPTYGVHSLTIEAGLQTKDTEYLKLSVDPMDPLRFRWFYRDVSRFLPLPTSGKYPFGLPTGPPPVTLVASLLWQLLL